LGLGGDLFFFGGAGFLTGFIGGGGAGINSTTTGFG
jgi:hypothetical protein